MSNVTAKIKIKGKNYEILVDLDEALKIKKGEGEISQALISESVFYNIKSGEHASEADLQEAFGTNGINIIAEKIIKSGEIQIPAEYRNQERQEKIKQVIDFLVKNAVDSRTGNPYTYTRIEESLSQAGINIENKPIEEQIPKVIEKIKQVIPIKIETKKIKITIPALHTGKVYGLLKEYKESEEWLNNGDLVCFLSIPIGLEMDFYDKLNSITHGSAIVEEIKS